MATDVTLDGGDGNWVVIDAAAAQVTGSDFMLDAASRRIGKNPYRRALVHDQSDGLTVNFGGDYQGGVTVASDTTIAGQLTVRGEISYAVKGKSPTQRGTAIIVKNLGEEIGELHLLVQQLTERVKALESQP